MNLPPSDAVNARAVLPPITTIDKLHFEIRLRQEGLNSLAEGTQVAQKFSLKHRAAQGMVAQLADTADAQSALRVSSGRVTYANVLSFTVHDLTVAVF